jgi:hypothetical protein
VREAYTETGIAAADFPCIHKADLHRFTVDRLMTTINRLGSRVDVKVSAWNAGWKAIVVPAKAGTQRRTTKGAGFPLTRERRRKM